MIITKTVKQTFTLEGETWVYLAQFLGLTPVLNEEGVDQSATADLVMAQIQSELDRQRDDRTTNFQLWLVQVMSEAQRVAALEDAKTKIVTIIE